MAQLGSGYSTLPRPAWGVGGRGPCKAAPILPADLRVELSQEQQVCGTAPAAQFLPPKENITHERNLTTGSIKSHFGLSQKTTSTVGVMGNDAMPARDDLEPRSTWGARGRQLRRHRRGQGVEKNVPQATTSNYFPQEAKPDSPSRPTERARFKHDKWGVRKGHSPPRNKSPGGQPSLEALWPLQARGNCLLSLQKPGPLAHSHWA